MYCSTYATLHKDYEQMRLDVINATPYVIVVEKALLPESPVKPPKELYTILAGTIALFVSIGLVFLFEYLDDTLKTPEDVTKALGLVTIGVISMIKGGRISHNSQSLIACGGGIPHAARRTSAP